MFRNFHPIYEDLLILTHVCKQWRRLISLNPDPSLWQRLDIANIRNCQPSSVFLLRFHAVLTRFGRFVKFFRVRKCNDLFTDALLQHIGGLSSLQYFELSDVAWSRRLLRYFTCFKSLTTIILEASGLVDDERLTEEDLDFLADKFPHLTTLGLCYSTVKADTLRAVKDLVSSRCGKDITQLRLERSRMDSSDINDVIKELPSLRKMSYGNDQIYGLPSFQDLVLHSKSLEEMELYQIGDFAEFHFSLPGVRKLSMNSCTSLSKVAVWVPSLRVLDLSQCSELRSLKKISAGSLRKFKIRKCNLLSLAELLSFLVRNPDVKSLELEVPWVSLRLDQHSSPSLEALSVYGNRDFLTAINVRCPKLQSLQFQRAAFRPTALKSLAVLADALKDLSLLNVPHLRQVNLDVEQVCHLKIDFDRRGSQIKPGEFTKLKFRTSGTKIDELVLQNFNLESLVISNCTVQCLTLENCNLDHLLNKLLSRCGQVQVLTLRRCYGPCQLAICSKYLKEVHIDCCSPLLMEHINLCCPSVELLNVTGCPFLPNSNELSIFAHKVQKLCPLLQNVNFCQWIGANMYSMMMVSIFLAIF